MSPTTVPPVPGRSAVIPNMPVSIRRVFDSRPFRTDGELLALAFADDGTLWTVEDPGVLRHWDIAGTQQIEWYPLSELEMLWVFGPGARLLVSGGEDLSLWDVATGQLQGILPQPSWITALALGGNATLAATGHDDGIVRLWDIARDELLRELSGNEHPISALAFSKDGQRLASAEEGKTIRLWDVATGRLLGVLHGHTDRIPALVWHPQGHRLYSAGWDTTARVWDVSTCEPIILLNSHATQVYAMTISADGRLLACADSASSIHLWDLDHHRPLKIFPGPEREIRCLTFDPSNRFLASGGGSRVVAFAPIEETRTASVTTTKRTQAELLDSTLRPLHVSASVALSPDGKRLAAISIEQGLHIWDASDSQCMLDLPEATSLYAVAYSADGRWIAGGGAASSIRIWEASQGRLQWTLEGPPFPITALAFAPNTPVLAAASALGCDIWLWSLETGEPILLIPDAVDGCAVEALAFHPQGKLLAACGIDWLATGGSDGCIKVWNVVDRHCVSVIRQGASRLAFHPSGDRLTAITLKKILKIFDIVKWSSIAELKGHQDVVTSIAYSPDGHWLASGSDDRTIRLWNAATGKAVARAELDTQIKTLVFCPESRSLFTGNGNRSCYQLDVQMLVEDGL